MTLVCVRLESSFGVPRITALADTRAAIKRNDGSFKTLSDTTAKLFAVPVRCYHLDPSPVIGAWTAPYHETTIGLGFSGSCFEALTIIAHISQTLTALVAPNGDEPRPTRDGLVSLMAKLCSDYFSRHSGDGAPVLLLLAFGFEDEKPWVANITYNKTDGVKETAVWADYDTLETVGQDDLFRRYAEDWRRRIRKHKDEVAKRPPPGTEDGTFERQLEIAHHETAERKAVEAEMLRQIENEFAEGIGGVLQRLELGIWNGQVVAGFTQDDRPYLDRGSYSVTPNALLGPIPIVEKMGRQIRKPTAHKDGA